MNATTFQLYINSMRLRDCIREGKDTSGKLELFMIAVDNFQEELENSYQSVEDSSVYTLEVGV